MQAILWWLDHDFNQLPDLLMNTIDCLIQCYFRIAQRRDVSVTKEVSMELDSNKKLTRQEKDERLGWR